MDLASGGVQVARGLGPAEGGKAQHRQTGGFCGFTAGKRCSGAAVSKPVTASTRNPRCSNQSTPAAAPMASWAANTRALK